MKALAQPALIIIISLSVPTCLWVCVHLSESFACLHWEWDRPISGPVTEEKKWCASVAGLTS